MSQHAAGSELDKRRLRLIDDIYATSASEIQCEEARNQMAQCAGRRLIDEAARREYPALFQHFRFCSDCEAEFSMLLELLRLEESGQGQELARIPPRPDASGESSLREALQPLRRLVEAVFTPMALQGTAVRGAIYQYQTPQFVLNLRSNKTTAKARTWTLYGMVQTADGQAFTEVDDITLTTLTEPDAASQHAGVEEDGSFVFKGLEAGRYRLALLTPEEEVVIRSFEVGFAV